MTTNPSNRNVTLFLLGELSAALTRYDGAAAAQVMRQLDTIAGRDFTLALSELLIAAGLIHAADNGDDITAILPGRDR